MKYNEEKSSNPENSTVKKQAERTVHCKYKLRLIKKKKKKKNDSEGNIRNPKAELRTMKRPQEPGP